jgi:HK97 gp10 family phage protein
MAKMNIKLPDEFTEKITRLGERTDEVISRALEAGAEVVYAKVKANLQAAIGKDTKYESRSTGELVSALGVSPVRVNRKGNHDTKVGFSEPRSDGSSNAKIANILEHGSSTQPARPFLKPARSSSRKECVEAIKTVLVKELENL